MSTSRHYQPEQRNQPAVTDRPDIPSASQTWQPGYIANHQAEQSRYLDAVSASKFVRQTAVNTMRLLALQPGQRVLEVGCGNGVFLSRLAQAVAPFGRVVGIDHAPAFVAEAGHKIVAAGLNAIVSVQQADAYHLPFRDASFDASHCERVLMHLEDPGAVLREMARVVRPGGVVVAAEPDWAGMRIDHADREAFDLAFARALQMRQRDMGLTLYRRMGEIGLVERRYLPAWSIIEDFATLEMYGLHLEPAIAALAAERALPRDRLQAILPALNAANTAGRFYAAAAFHVVSGVVPG